MKKLFTILLALVCSVGMWAATEVTWTASEQGYTNEEVVTNFTIDANISVTSGTCATDAKYYTSGTAWRFYKNGEFTISAASGFVITNIDVTFHSTYVGVFTTNVGTWTSPSWTGSAQSVKFSQGNNGSTARFQKITVTYETTSSDPVITASDINIEPDATSGEIPFTVTNPTAATATASLTTGDFISNVAVSGTKVTFDATENTSADSRSATITISYTGANDKVVTVTQLGKRNYGIEAYRLNLVQCGADAQGVDTTTTDRGAVYAKVPSAVFAANDDKVATVNLTTVYAGRQPMGAKFGSSKAKGTLTITLATATNIQSIVFNAAMYGATSSEANADKGFTVKLNDDAEGTSFGLSAGNKVLEDLVLYVGGQSVTKITIEQNNATQGRFYLHHIAVCTAQTSVAISDAEYATYYNASSAFVMPAGLEGIIVDGRDGDELNLTTSYNEGDVVPAGEALILHGNVGTYNLVATETNNAKVGTNMLKGTSNFNDLTTGGVTFYRLSKHEGLVGFYYGAEGGVAFKPGANKAYLALPADEPAPARFIFGQQDVPTELQNVSAETVSRKVVIDGRLYILRDGNMFDLNGRLVK